jgi:drug/metabolite transporter (DMT)-like permease
MNFAGIAGLLLVFAGIAWIFMAEYASRRPRRRGDPGGFLEKVLKWASKNLARKFLPGVLMIVLGVFLLVATSRIDDDGDTETEEEAVIFVAELEALS